MFGMWTLVIDHKSLENLEGNFTQVFSYFSHNMIDLVIHKMLLSFHNASNDLCNVRWHSQVVFERVNQPIWSIYIGGNIFVLLNVTLHLRYLVDNFLDVGILSSQLSLQLLLKQGKLLMKLNWGRTFNRYLFLILSWRLSTTCWLRALWNEQWFTCILINMQHFDRLSIAVELGIAAKPVLLRLFVK